MDVWLCTNGEMVKNMEFVVRSEAFATAIRCKFKKIISVNELQIASCTPTEIKKDVVEIFFTS